MKRILSVLLALVMIVGMIPMSILTASAATSEVVFEFGANGTASHKDGSTAKTEYTETVGNYTLSITSGTKMYPSSYDAKGNSCIKLGTSSAVGGFTFTVHNDVTSVKIAIAKYKTNTTKVSVNGTAYTLTKSSNDGAYDEITVDTSSSSNKTVTVTTVSGGVRAMVNSITFICSSGSDTEPTTPSCEHNYTSVVTDPTCTESGYTTFTCSLCEDSYVSDWVDALGHKYGEWVVDPAATCTEAGQQTKTCATCGDVQTEVIAATGHTYVNGVCGTCGADAPAAVATLITSADQLVSGKYILMVSSGYAMGVYDNGWVTAVKPALSNGEIVDAAGGIWTLTVNGSSVTIEDANGVAIAPKTGNNNGIIEGEYSWAWSVNEDGTFVFAGTGDDTTRLASNTGSENKFRAYKNDTVTGNTTGYLANFAVYKMNEGSDVEPDPDQPACTHANTTNETVDATCTEDGYEKTICADCGEVLDTEVFGATGHNYVNGICTECDEAEPSVPTTPNAQWILVTDASSLAAGDQIVIVASGFDYALSTEQRSSNRGSVAITKDGNVVEINDSVQILTLETGTVDGTFGFNTGSGYLYASSSSSNQLKTQATNNANGSFKIEIADSGVATIKAQGTNTRNWMRFNDSNDPKLFSCYGSGQADISIYKYTIVDGCVHEVADDAWTVVTEATCETAGSKTGTCPKCGETVEKEISALGHDYSYNAETGMMVCANCGDSFMNTIAEAKAYTDGNQVYYIKGIVTYVSGQTVYMQDVTGAICVYFTDAENAANIAVGDELLVMDTMTTYKGLIETTYTKSTEVQVLSNGNQLPVQTVTIADLKADTTNEYLGERVQIVDATIGMINAAGNTALTVGADTINLYKASGLASNVTENDIVTVTAIVSTYNGYQLLVNPDTAAADVVVTTEGVPSDLELSTIATAKAGTVGEFYKIKGVVTFIDGATVYMQDETAGMALYLASGVTAPAIGDEIEAIGAFDTYNGLRQLEGANFETISTGNTVNAKEVTLADLQDDTYLSEKVSLKELTITAVGTYSTSYKNVDYTVSDGTNTIKLYRAPAATADSVLAVGDVIDVIAVVGTYNGYQLRVVEESDIVLAPTVELTHISLDPTNDALGFKAAVSGNLSADAQVGMILSVNGGAEKTYLVKVSALKNEGVFTLRLNNIMANNGGEMEIKGTPIIVDGDVTITGQSTTTTMKDALLYVNDNFAGLDATKQAAVQALYANHGETIAAWIEAAGKTNNIASSEA